MVATRKPTKKEQANAERLTQLLKDARAHGNDLRAAVRAYSGKPIQALANEIGQGRNDVSMCLGQMYGRQYPAIRRALESVLGLAPYALNTIMGETDGGDGRVE